MRANFTIGAESAKKSPVLCWGGCQGLAS